MKTLTRILTALAASIATTAVIIGVSFVTLIFTTPAISPRRTALLGALFFEPERKEHETIMHLGVADPFPLLVLFLMSTLTIYILLTIYHARKNRLKRPELPTP